MSAVLLSVKPVFALRLLSGHKTAEVRRRFPKLHRDTVVYLYASSPIRAVIGVLRIDDVHTGTPDALWPRFHATLDIAEEYFRDYLVGRDIASVIELRLDERWEPAVSLKEMRASACLEPPQSYRYLDTAQERALRGLAVSA